MKFVKVSADKPVVDFIAKRLTDHLNKNEKVLWLLSGGSTAYLAVEVSKKLSTGLSNLTVSLIDERYGPPGHENSNWEHIRRLGLNLTTARLAPILSGKSLNETVKSYDSFLKTAFKMDYSIALMGIGPDSHIAGIKPKSPATIAKTFATSYDWDDFKGRITMTFEAIKQLNCSISYLTSKSKGQAIMDLQKDLSPSEYPSQILKQAKEAIIFNDMLGEEVL